MSNYIASLTPATFAPTIQGYCAEHGWEIDQIKDDLAVLKFEADSGNMQTIAIFPVKNTLEFVAHSDLGFDSDDDIPHRLSTLLLRKNSGLLLGSWSIEDIHSKSVFSITYDEEMGLMDANRFERIVRYLVKECDELEAELEDLG